MSDRDRGVLFDVDGTLVDTTFLHATCWGEALRQHGQYVPMADLHHAIGMSSDQLLDRCLGEDRDRGADDALVDTHLALYKQWWGRLSPLPGAPDLLRACTKRGLDVVLASSASEEELSALTSALDADDAVGTATSSSDADTGKPAPDILQAALDRSGLAADRVVFVGDAVWDGRAAQRAGVTFIGLTCGGSPASDLREAGAVEVWKDPAHLLENIENSAIGALIASTSG
jgi:HAD superfamily hydrolase (TIGR01509 family)